MTLTSQSGRTVSVLATPQTAEFMHLNGTVAPMLAATVPQDTYVSARLTVTDATVTCITLNSYGGLLSSELGSAVGNAVMRNSAPIGPGSALRFVGLVFNDNGTLRMDCSEILDGVPL